MHLFWFTLALIVVLAGAAALAVLLDTEVPALWIAPPVMLLTFLVTDFWHRRRHQRRETYYRQLLEHLPIRLRIRDLRGRVLTDNRPHERSPVLQDDLPLDCMELPDTLPPLSRRAWQGLREVRAHGRRTEMSIELPAERAGEVLAYRQIFFPVFDGSRRVAALGSLLIDQSDLYATATALRALTDDLEDQVRERTFQLAKAKESAERQAELQAEFMTHLSHEIRSPLSALIGLAHLASRESRDARLNGYLEKMRKAATHLLDIVNDVLDFGRLDAGRLPVAQIPFSPNELVRNVIDMIGEAARDKGLSIGVELDEQIPNGLSGDPLRISQILINLASNAVKFTAQGRIDFRMLLLNRGSDGVRLRFEVQDTGAGIAAEDLPRLFKPFSQLSARTDRRSGSGLGLAISSRLASLMGGELGVRSTAGQGSLFFLELFCQESTEPPTAVREGESAERPLKSLAGHTVLLVDDDPLMREVTGELLQMLGLHVRVAADGQQALDCLATENGIALVFMDLQMPGLDGPEVTRRLRQRWPDLPVIAISGNTRESDRARCRSVGMNGFLVKPAGLEQLVDTLQRWLPSAPDPQPKATLEPPLPEIFGLDQSAALKRMLGNRSLYLRMLRRFLDENPITPLRLRQLLEDNRPAEAVELLHRFKSLAATLGAVELQALSERFETQVQAGDDHREALEAFATEHERLCSTLQRELERL